MRLPALLCCLLLPACGLKRLMPQGPVLNERQRSDAFPTDTPSGVHYTGPRTTTLPVMPMMVWAVAYDLDLVVSTKHPEWDMLELARLATPDGPVWIAKDARAGSLEQSIVADFEGVQTWLPELPVPRTRAPVQVDDQSTDSHLNIDASYTNPDGQRVVVHYEGPVPTKRMKKRNGSTMGHSQDAVIAVLDLPVRNLARRASLSIDGEPQPLRRIAGLVPFAMALTQTQAGIAVADIQMSTSPQTTDDAHPRSLTTTHHLPGGDLAQLIWQLTVTDMGADWVQHEPLRTLQHRFIGHERPEWVGATVLAWNDDTPLMRITAHPALPDLASPFDGVATSRFVIDVAGQPSHAVGTLSAEWVHGEVVVNITPQAPWWVADRPMRSIIRVQDAQVSLLTERIDN